MQDAETLERAENPRAVIGGNNPPPYDPEKLAECQKKVTDFTDAAGAWLDLKKIETSDQSEKVTDFVTGARKVWKEIDETRKAAKQIHDEAGKAVQAAFTPLLDKIKLSVDKISAMQADWLKREKDRMDAEKAEADRIAKEQREAAEKAAREAEARNDVSGMVEAEAMRVAAERAAKAAAKPAKAAAGSASGGGRTMSLRTTYSCKVDNIITAMMRFKDHPAMTDLLERLATADVLAQKGEKTAPAGFKLLSNSKAV